MSKLYTNDMVMESVELLSSFDIPTIMLEKAIELHFKRKSWMIERLKFNVKDNYRIRIPLPLPTGEANPDLWEFVKEVCRVKSEVKQETFTPIDFTFVQDSRKNKFKFTKVFLSIFDTLWYRENRGDAPWFENIINKSGCIVGAESNESAKRRTAVSLPIWYGDQIMGNRNVVLSILPIDFFGASTNAKASSCYRPGGEYFNGVITNMMSPNVIVSFVENSSTPGYKIGRSWYYVNDTMIIQGRLYGSIFDFHHLYLRNYLEKHMGGDWVFHPNKKISSYALKSDGPSYLDNDHGTITVNKIMTTKMIVLPHGLCLQCGRSLNSGAYKAGGYCGNCHEGDYNYVEEEVGTETEDADLDGKKCSVCGRSLYDGDVMEFGDSVMCESCYNDSTVQCGKCGDRMWNDDACYDGDHIYCQECYDQLFFSCYDCGGSFDNNDRVVRWDEEWICQGCCEKHYSECEDCGSVFVFRTKDLIMVKDSYYCDDCYSELSDEEKEK